jgi:Zn-finger nucleic acid-binding protein
MSKLNCPVCHAHFNEVVKDGILIDVCSQCRGVWLDRGELEKLMSSVRHENQRDQVQYESRTYDQKPSHHMEDQGMRYNHDNSYYQKNKYRRKSKLESFFDIFD